MVKPLGLPVGSVRALLMLGLGAAAILGLRSGWTIEPWLATALIVSAASYFSARSATPSSVSPAAEGGEERVRPPLGLPAGTVRFLFLAGLGYGAWLWFKDRELVGGAAAAAWVLAAYVLGVFVRWVLRRLDKPADPGAMMFRNLLALISLLCVGGLVVIAAMGRGGEVPSWVQPMLAAVTVHYFATR